MQSRSVNKLTENEFPACRAETLCTILLTTTQKKSRSQGYAKLLRFSNKQLLGAPLETPDSAPQATHGRPWDPVKIWDFLQLNGCRMPIVFQE